MTIILRACVEAQELIGRIGPALKVELEQVQIVKVVSVVVIRRGLVADLVVALKVLEDLVEVQEVLVADNIMVAAQEALVDIKAAVPVVGVVVTMADPEVEAAAMAVVRVAEVMADLVN